MVLVLQLDLGYRDHIGIIGTYSTPASPASQPQRNCLQQSTFPFATATDHSTLRADFGAPLRSVKTANLEIPPS